MPVTNYEEVYQSTNKWFFNNPQISDKNKQYVKQYLSYCEANGRKPSRKSIVLRHLARFLCYVPDVENDMKNKTLIEDIFAKLAATYGTSYYATIINVTNAFVRWLNDGEKPKGFVTVKNMSKKKQRRNLGAEDMWTWEEGERLISFTNSIQLKAMVMMQLEGGFRPSEFVDLRYGDVVVKENFIVAHVRDGKTGARYCILYRSVPFVLRWLQHHPARKNDSPLWITENESKSHKKQSVKYVDNHYEYCALLKRLRGLTKKAGMSKPIDLYNLRHSACTLAKKNNIPQDLAAANFGHSVDYFVNVYGRLTCDDNVGRFGKAYGVNNSEKEKVLNNVACPRCKFINQPKSDLCEECSAPLSLKEAIKIEKDKEKAEMRVVELEKKFEALLSMLKNDARELITQKIR